MEKKLSFLDELISIPFGQDLFDAYEISSHLAKTNMSEVVLLKSLKGQTFAVLKVMSKQLGFTIDYGWLLDIDHPNLIKTIAVAEGTAFCYTLKPFIKGLTLKQMRDQLGPLSLDQLLTITQKLASAMAYIHDHDPKIILRDLKPENVIMLDAITPVIIDLESARLFTIKDQDTVLIGTPGYASPEHYGIMSTDERSDIYVLGMTLHYLITGDIWYNRNQVDTLFTDKAYKPYLKIISNAIHIDPEKRYASVKAMVGALKKSVWLDKWSKAIVATGLVGTLLMVAVITLLIKSDLVNTQLDSSVNEDKAVLQVLELTYQIEEGTLVNDTNIETEIDQTDEVVNHSTEQGIEQTTEEAVSQATTFEENQIETESHTIGQATTSGVEQTSQSESQTKSESDSEPTTTQTSTQAITETQTNDQTLEVEKSNHSSLVIGQEVVFQKGSRTELTKAVNFHSETRYLPFGLVQVPEMYSFLTMINTKDLPAELSGVDSIGVGSGYLNIDKVYQHTTQDLQIGRAYARQYALTGSSIIEFSSDGAYFYGNYVCMYEKDTVKAIVIVGIDETVVYKIYE